MIKVFFYIFSLILNDTKFDQLYHNIPQSDFYFPKFFYFICKMLNFYPFDSFTPNIQPSLSPGHHEARCSICQFPTSTGVTVDTDTDISDAHTNTGNLRLSEHPVSEFHHCQVMVQHSLDYYLFYMITCLTHISPRVGYFWRKK